MVDSHVDIIFSEKGGRIMKRKEMTRVSGICMAVCLLLAGCGNKGVETAAATAPAEETVDCDAAYEESG